MTLDIQMVSMVSSVATGIWLGASFDTYERISGKRHMFKWTRIMNDFLFWVAQALLYFILLLNINNGEVRVYLLLSIILGYAVYRAIFEGVYRRVLERVLKVIHAVYMFLVHLTYVIFINPIKGLLKLLLRLGMIVLITIWGLVSFVFKWTLRPIIFLGQFIDNKLGHPFLKQRKAVLLLIKRLLIFFHIKKK
ncbi:spore cortex biosynthesis protein YabQ [Salipaludibacillus agaradhaerens]|uniref:Spore cortex biosynthesis protein YabQ n=1 Tax=Salipaludibacillus agaradhaerens TaxID=76935 RepID=A0A9Q4FZ53_SALAG|nr:spore cortex biosynthesis protein YabQ [Salipaludibacillus agaradhaerens]MCR6098400.1 spore cortex biosynthesis protein YabQ [Salipaludibacillus agaradhaerens]MCR6115970.1 spore cortex biosynthesis protein YabQ [Salipaludibacillus agaradhaerens]